MSSRLVHVVRVLAALTVTAGLVACGDDGGDKSAATTVPSRLAPGVASYEIVANRAQRLLVAVPASDNQSGVLAFGSIDLEFAYTGTKEKEEKPSRKFKTEAVFTPLPGQRIDVQAALQRPPALAQPSQVIGVYAARDVTFPVAGVWTVEMTVPLDGKTERASAPFDVLVKGHLPAPGEPAPWTENPIYGDPSVPPKAIDSRFDPAAPPPAPTLHSTSVAAALSTQRPAFVVVSTPVFCQSRFCGPITDSAERLAAQYGDRMSFVHLEVWEDFEQRKVNEFAKAWITAPDGTATEPWVYVIGAHGVISERFDNVASDGEMEAAVKKVLGIA